jgi:hypothetical protein
MRFSEGEKHLEELTAQREYVHRQLARSKQQTIDVEAAPQTVWGEDTSSLSSITPITRKTRTRSPSSQVQDIEIPAAPTPHLRPIKVSVNRDNIAVFKAIFPKNGEDSSRSFAWQHFLAAMTDAGFNILQSQGSAVTLKLEKSQGVNTIVVHRPYPVATISKCRSRLSRNHGADHSMTSEWTVTNLFLIFRPDHAKKHWQKNHKVVWLA